MRTVIVLFIYLLSFIKVSAQADYHVHIVQAGSTLYSISKEYGVTVNEIKKWNNLISNNIEIGQKLKIYQPGNRELEQTNFKEVADTLPKIPLSKESILNDYNDYEDVSEKLVSVYDLNVIEYYSSELNLETELQKATYKNSSDYLLKKEELRRLKEEMLKTTYFLKMEEPFKNVDYDMSSGGFKIPISSNIGFAVAGATPPKSYQKIELAKCQIVQQKSAFGGIDDLLLLKMDAANALKIEENRENISIYFLFRISDKYTKSFQFTDMQNNDWNVNAPVFRPVSVRIVVMDNSNDEIYYNKIFY